MKVTIDQESCMGAAVCTDVCEKVFTLDEHGKSQIRDQYRRGTPYEGDVPNDLACVKQAANYCPANAISIEYSDNSQGKKEGDSSWRRRFWIGSAVVAVAISIVQYVLYWQDLIDVKTLLSTPLIIIGGIGLGYLMQYLHEHLSEETLVRERRILAIILGTLLLGFLIWISVFIFLSLFELPRWWEPYGLLITIPSSYVSGGLIGYWLSKRVHVNRASYILMGMFLGFFGTLLTSNLVLRYGETSITFLNHWSIRILTLVGPPIGGGILGDWIGKLRNYYLPGQLTYEPKTKSSREANK